VTPSAHSNNAMLTYLAGDDDVRAAAAQIWDASGHLLNAQRDLEAATNAYARAIADTGIPIDHVERLGATLILSLHRQRLLDETERIGPDTDPST